jgi:hypothetical protein
MNLWEYLALGLELWTALGLLGLAISLARRERSKLQQGVWSLLGVWVIYLAVLLAVSFHQPEARVPLGQPLCFHAMCFTVERGEELPGFPARNRARLVRVTLRVENRGKTMGAEEGVRAYLRDGQGRQWVETPGVSGNPLDGRVGPGGSVVSEPVFQVAPDATGLAMVLTHGRWSRHTLVIGDAESLGHRVRVMELGR